MERVMVDNENNVVEKTFSARSQEERDAFLKYTWCNTCMEVDLGMEEVKEYQSDDRLWLEGKCLKCGDIIVTEIEEE